MVQELHTCFHTKTTQVFATSLSIAQSHVRTCSNHCQINNMLERNTDSAPGDSTVLVKQQSIADNGGQGGVNRRQTK